MQINSSVLSSRYFQNSTSLHSGCKRRKPWSLSASSSSDKCTPWLVLSVLPPSFLLLRNLCRDGSGGSQCSVTPLPPTFISSRDYCPVLFEGGEFSPCSWQRSVPRTGTMEFMVAASGHSCAVMSPVRTQVYFLYYHKKGYCQRKSTWN